MADYKEGDAPYEYGAAHEATDGFTKPTPKPQDQAWSAYESPLQTYKKTRKQSFGKGFDTYQPSGQWGIPDFWKEQGKKYSKDPSRLWLQGGRQLVGRGMGRLGDIASGKTSMVDGMQDSQVAAMQARAQSQAQSQRGGYNPTAARTGGALASSARSQTAPGAAVAKQAEQLGAAQSWLSNAADMRGREADWWSKQSAWNSNKAMMDAKAHTTGRMDKELIRSQRMALMDMMFGQKTAQNQMDANQQNRDYQFIGQNVSTLGPLYKTWQDSQNNGGS